MSLYEFYNVHRNFFNNCKCKQYPLLVKILDCNDKLSVQVHPRVGPDQKNEAWFVLDAKNKAEIIYGHTAKNRNTFNTLVKNRQ
jgi:mannose-6-phosphate isomerase